MELDNNARWARVGAGDVDDATEGDDDNKDMELDNNAHWVRVGAGDVDDATEGDDDNKATNTVSKVPKRLEISKRKRLFEDLIKEFNRNNIVAAELCASLEYNTTLLRRMHGVLSGLTKRDVAEQNLAASDIDETDNEPKPPSPSLTRILDTKVLESAVSAHDSSANSEHWSCAGCEFLNDPALETCELCERVRSGIATSLIHQDPPPLDTHVEQPVLQDKPDNARGSDSNSEPWYCPTCTFNNDPALETCYVCERPRNDVLTSSSPSHQVAEYGTGPASDAESNGSCQDEDAESGGSSQGEDVESNEPCHDKDKQRACHPEFDDYKSRFASFWNMPESVTQSAQSLAKAGFFYEGNKDTFRCFFCDGDLHSLKPNDDPWIEHAKLYPDCGNVKNEKKLIFDNDKRHIYHGVFAYKDTISNGVDLSDNTLCSVPPGSRNQSGTADRSKDSEDVVKSRNQSFPQEHHKGNKDTTSSNPPDYQWRSIPADIKYIKPPDYASLSSTSVPNRGSTDHIHSQPPAYRNQSFWEEHSLESQGAEFQPAYRDQSLPYVPRNGSKGPVLFFGRDILSQLIYEKALKEGTETDESIRLMVIGCHGQGKTSLVRRLLGEDIEDVSSTNGIDICRCITGEDGTHWTRQLSENAENESIKRIASVVKKTVPATINFVSSASSKDHFESKLAEQLEHLNSARSDAHIECLNVWDFGGQFVYYATHQLFHSRKAVYLLVFNLCVDLNARVEDEDFLMQKDEKTMGDYIEFWLNSIHSFVGNEDGTEPAVILVGTHADQLQNMHDADKYFEAVRDLFSERNLGLHIQEEQFAISTTDPSADEMQRLRETIISIGKRQKEGERIPAKWIPLERTLKDRRNENIISIDEVLQIDKKNEYPIGNEEEVKSFLEFQHISGNFFYFNEGEMSRHVVVNPLFLIHAFRCIITSKRFCSQKPKLRPLWQTLKERAILEPKLLYSVWQNESEEFIEFQEVLISYLKKHRIIGETQQIDMTSDNTSTKPLGFYIVPSLLRKSDNGSVKNFLEGKLLTPVSLVYEFENEAVVPVIFQRVTAAAIGTWSILHFKGKPLLFEDVSVYKIDLSHAGMLLHANNRIEILVVNLCIGRRVAEEITNCFRRFTEVMIGAEFQKLRPLEQDITMPVKESFRCFHEKHDGKGSVTTYQLEFLQNVKELMICCPDHVTHDNLNSRAILELWYNNRIAAKRIPRKKLTDKEYSILSTNCVGYGWQQLAYQLGIPEKKVEQIDMDNKEVSLKVFKVFKTWDMMNHENATLDTLVGLIQYLPRNIISLDALNNIIDKFY